MNVWSKCASISVTITDIWTKFGTERKYCPINTSEWPNSHKLKIQYGGGRHLEFRKKNLNNFELDKDILHQIIWEDAPRRRGDDHVTKSRNRKLIRMTSSNKCLKDKCVDLSDNNSYFNQIWYRAQLPHYQHSHNKSETAAAAILNFGKMSITLDWIQIYAPNLWKMHHGHAEMTT